MPEKIQTVKIYAIEYTWTCPNCGENNYGDADEPDFIVECEKCEKK